MEDPFASEGEDEMLPIPSKDNGRRTDAGSFSSSSASTSSTVLPAASATSITSLAQQIRKIKNAASAPRVLGGHHTIRTKNYGSLIVDSTVDGRSKMTYHRELYDAKINIATSFDPSSLTCYSCWVVPRVCWVVPRACWVVPRASHLLRVPSSTASSAG